MATSADALSDDQLRSSLYYPAGRTGWAPLCRLTHETSVFVYVDYGRSRVEIEHALRSIDSSSSRGGDLRCAGIRTLDGILVRGRARGPRRGRGEPPWALMATLERRIGSTVRSLTVYYCNADALEAFEPIYANRGVSPRIFCSVNPGCGFGLNWMHAGTWLLNWAERFRDAPGGSPDQIVWEASWWREHEECCEWPYGWDLHALADWRFAGGAPYRGVRLQARGKPPLAPTRTEPTMRSGRAAVLRRTRLDAERPLSPDPILITSAMLGRHRSAWAALAETQVILAAGRSEELCRGSKIVPLDVESVCSAAKTLPLLTAAAERLGCRTIVSHPLGLEDEGPFLAEWANETGYPLRLEVCVTNPGDVAALAPWLPFVAAT